jgi:hypothetical protein
MNKNKIPFEIQRGFLIFYKKYDIIYIESKGKVNKYDVLYS